jgi:hypothetical protein
VNMNAPSGSSNRQERENFYSVELTCCSPLICLLERYLTGIRSGHRTTKTAVVTYSDDVTIF